MIFGVAGRLGRLPMTNNKHPSEWTEDEFIAAVLRERPEFGTRVVRGIRLKTKAERFVALGRRLLEAKEKP